MKAYHTRINADGQISLSQEVLRALDKEPGDLVDIHIDESGVHIVRHEWTIETVAGSVKTPPHLYGMSIEEIIRKGREDWAKEKWLEFKNLGKESDTKG